MKNFKNAGFTIEDVFGKKAVVILLSACTTKELDKFFVCSKMNPADFSRLIENLRLYTTEETQGKVDELEKMYPVATESTTTADDARKDVNYMMSLIWKDVVLPDFKAAYPTAWAAVTEEA